ncbi:5'/3'-nucleotidase SurE [Pseudomonas sp. JDS28PS106]|uniref:5'/3'-nucleotidase SurE n=1 Tax=Pseudomonas sp. JDS28PS106 TaxID=2497235 RepID=UPI002FCFD135
MSTSGYLFERVLLTNDDGIADPGLRVLEEIAAQIAREVWVVAPLLDQSGTSHSLSLHDPLRISHHGERRMAVSGTPGDCVALALGHLMRDGLPDLVLSGVNRGANLGLETVFSGTVGAAMTALMFGVKSIALSQAFVDRAAVPWEVAQAHGITSVRRVLELDWPADACINLNFPACAPEQVKPLKLTTQGRGHLKDIQVQTRTDPRDLDYYWLRLNRQDPVDADDAEGACLRQGHVTATPLMFERTHSAALAQMRARLSAGE